MSLEWPEDNRRRDAQPVMLAAAANSTAPADQAAQLLAELQTARERAGTAAKLVLDLNGRLETARTHQQQYQSTLADLQTALQTQQAAKAEADAALQTLTLKLAAADADRQQLTEQLGARESALETETAQRSAEQELFEQQLAGARAALLASQQAHQDIEQQLVQQAQTEAALRQEALELKGQAEHQAQIEADLRQQLRTAAASLAERFQEATTLRQELAEAQRQHLAVQDKVAAMQAAHAAHSAELQKLQGQQQALEQTLATERNLWKTLQDQWTDYKLANQAAQDAVQRQLSQAEAALRAEQMTLAAKADENAALTEQLRLAQQELAARTDTQSRLRAEYEGSLAELEQLRQQLSERDGRLVALEARLQQRDAALAARPAESTTFADAAPKPAAPAPASNARRLSQPGDMAHIQPVAADTCPHLGLRADRETRHGYASTNNRCYARNAALEVTSTQQANFCLRDSHRQCPVFTGALRSPKEPIHTDARLAGRDPRPNGRPDKK